MLSAHILCIDLIPPVIDDILNVTVHCGEGSSPAVIGSPTVTDNEDLNPTIYHNDTTQPGCTLIRTWTARDDAGNRASAIQVIVFSEPQPPVVTSPDQIMVACGSLEDASTSLAHNRIAVQHPCGRPVTLHYTDSANLTQCGFIFSRVWQVDDDCNRSALFTQVIHVLSQQFPDTPRNGLLNARIDKALRWPQYPSATSYQVYVWRESDEERPSEPATVTTSRVYYPSPHYPPGTRMLWQIVYVLGVNMTVPSPIWNFETEPRPDLEVINVIVPAVAYSGQSFSVSWTVINSGNLSVTNFFFNDEIYLSRTTSISDGRRVSRVIQHRFLDPQDGFNSAVEINLAQNDIGVFYVFVITDASNIVSQFSRLIQAYTVSCMVKSIL